MKKEIEALPLIHPVPIVIIGTIINNLPNFTTIGDIAVAGINPPLVMLSLNENHNAMNYINTSHKMSVNIMQESSLHKVDYAGMFSSKEKDKSSLFDCDIIDGLPIIKEAPISIILDEIDRVQVKHRIILVCKVRKTFIENDITNENDFDFQKLKPIIYGLDNHYYGIGKKIGVGYSEGTKIKEKAKYELNP